jgi:uncharacterized protein YqjF (DUF2071 family)
MSKQVTRGVVSIQGTLRSRLLINKLVDPDEVTAHLPAGVRPHVTSGSTIVGCCLLDIAAVRPAPLPATFGLRLRAVAHRFSVEWEDECGLTEVGVYVPTRHTDSRSAVLAGGRWFPGAHRNARIELIDDGQRLDWHVAPTDHTKQYGLTISASTNAVSSSMTAEPIGAICVGASIGVSPDHHGVLEAARMTPNHRLAQLVHVDDLQSEFLTQFTTAEPAPSYLMRDVDVVWTRERAPRTSPERVSA